MINNGWNAIKPNQTKSLATLHTNDKQTFYLWLQVTDICHSSIVSQENRIFTNDKLVNQSGLW